MEHSNQNRDSRVDAADQPAGDFYIPGTPRMGSPGPVERFLTKLFRARGTWKRVRVDVRR